MKTFNTRRRDSLYLAESLEPRRLLAGVTLITHGFGGDTTGWVTAMANAIDARADFDIDPITYTVTVTDPGEDNGPLDVQISSLDGPELGDAAAANPEIIILLNWSSLAGDFSINDHHRSTVDVAAAVTERLLAPSFFIGLGGKTVASWPMHLIGHSRGASLVGELARDLGMHGVWVDHVTTLDPHPVDNVSEPNIPFVNLQWGDSTPRATDNVVFWDNYWRTEGATSFDFTGQLVEGAHNLQLNENILAQSNAGYSFEHSDTHLWYHGTIDTAATATNGEHNVPTNWYPTSFSMGPRDQIGYYYSRNVGGTRPATGVGTPFNGTGRRWPVEHSGGQWPNVGQLALEYSSPVYNTDETIFISYRYQDLDSDATIWWFADDDLNPNNPGPMAGGGAPLLLGTQSVSPHDFVDTGSFHFGPTLAPGTWRIFARIIDAGGRARYAFLPQAITITDPPVLTEETTGQTVTGSVPEGGVSSHYIHANAGDMLYAAMTRTGDEPWFTPWLGLYAPNGAALAGNWEPVTTTVGSASVPQTGMYRFDARDLSNDAAGGYALTIVHLPATADGGGDGGLLVSGQTRSAGVGVGDVDVFMFYARAGQSISVVVTRTSSDTNFNPTIYLYDPNGDALDGRWDYLGTGAGRNNAPYDGMYYVLVRDFYADTAGAYKITLALMGGEQNADDDAAPIQSGQTRSAFMGPGDLDIYTFTAGKGQSIGVGMMVTGGDAAFSPNLALYGPGGALIQTKWDYAGVGVGTTSAPLDGTYYVVASDYGADATGSYNLTVAVLPEVQDPGGDGGPIASGQTRSAAIDKGDIDVFTIDAHIGDSISVVITETSGDAYFNPYLGLYGPNGILLDGRWDVTGTGVSELSVTQEGTYYIYVADYEYDGTGNYNITAARVRGAQQIGGDGGTLQNGQVRSASIGLGDIDVFAFAAQTGQKITGILTETAGGPAFNPYLAVFAPDGTYLYGNWDVAGAGVVVNSAPQTGVYYLVAYDYGGEDGGDYTLSLTLTNTAPPVNSLFSPLNDLFLLRRNAGDPAQLDSWFNTLPLGSGGPIRSEPAGGVTTLNLLGGDDAFTLDYLNGPPLVPGATIDAGPGSDAMRILGTPGADAVTFGTSQLNFGGVLNLAGVESRTYDGQGGGDNLSVTGGSLAFDLPQQFSSLNIAAGASAKVTPGGGSPLRTGSLSVGGQLDLADNPLILDYDGASPIDAVNSLIQAGRNGGMWNGSGIVTGAAPANRTLGVAEAARVLNLAGGQTALWHGQIVDASTVLVLYTLPGDADLNLRIDIDDYFVIDQGYGRQLTGYFNGDFNYSGAIDADDYFLIDQAYIQQGAPQSVAGPVPLSAPVPSPFNTMPIADDDSVLEVVGAELF